MDLYVDWAHLGASQSNFEFPAAKTQHIVNYETLSLKDEYLKLHLKSFHLKPCLFFN